MLGRNSQSCENHQRRIPRFVKSLKIDSGLHKLNFRFLLFFNSSLANMMSLLRQPGSQVLGDTWWHPVVQSWDRSIPDNDFLRRYFLQYTKHCLKHLFEYSKNQLNQFLREDREKMFLEPQADFRRNLQKIEGPKLTLKFLRLVQHLLLQKWRKTDL